MSPNGVDGEHDAPRIAFHPNPALRLAQLVALAQAVVATITGANLIRGATVLTDLHTGVNLTQDSALNTRYGIGILVIAAVLIVLAAVVSHPSKIPRALLAILEIAGLGVTLAAHFGGGSVLGFVTVLTLGAGGSALLPFGAVIGIEAGLIYLLAIHPPTYSAFSR